MAKMSFDQEERQRFARYAHMRNTQPVAQQYGAWNVFRYADVQRVLSDHATFSSQFGGVSDSVEQAIASSIIGTDPPRHRQLRALVSQALTPRTVARLEPRIHTIVHDLLDQVQAAGQMDLIEDLA